MTRSWLLMYNIRVMIANENFKHSEEGKNIAVLSHSGGFSSFRYGDDVIRFATSKSLKHYVRVKKWVNGYIEVGADYGHGEEEDYIDLIPILNNLYYDADSFLAPIKRVEVRYV